MQSPTNPNETEPFTGIVKVYSTEFGLVCGSGDVTDFGEWIHPTGGTITVDSTEEPRTDEPVEGFTRLSDTVNEILRESVRNAWASREEPVTMLHDSEDVEDFPPSSPLRADDDEDDTLGSEFDPGTMGTAETWFRSFRGDE